jgi:Spy/CpxP family protein refolding chaperone
MKTRRALVIALVVSIALNLVAVGMFLGQKAGPRPAINRVDPVFGLRRLLGDLPEERARTLAPLYREYFATMRPRFREIRETQAALRAAMLADPLDEAGLRLALKSFEAQLGDSQRASQDAFVALAAALTLEERQRLVESMGRRPERWRPGDKPRKPGRESEPGPGPEQEESPPPQERPPYHHIPPEPPPQ